MTGIEGVGAYAPAYRVDADAVEAALGQFQAAGVERTAVPDADEDALTMAHEAGALALTAAERDGSEIAGLYLATTTPSVEEEALTPRLASTLGLGDDIETRQLTGSTRAGVAALVAALDSTDEGRTAGGEETGDGTSEAPYLVVASDAPRGAPDDAIEHAAGAGSAAIVVGPGGPGTVLDRAEQVSPFPGTRFRPAGSAETTGLGVTGYDRQAFRETVETAAGRLEDDLGSADTVALQSPDGKLPYRAAGPLGVETDAIRAGTTVHDLGDTGTASPLLGFASARADGYDDIGVIGYGSGGGAIALSIDAADVPVETSLAAEESLSYSAYLRIRGELTSGEPAGGGAYVSVPSWKRTIPQRHRLVAGRCRNCGELVFPPTGACTDCGTLDEYDEVRLPGTGTVEAATEIGQGGAPPEFVEQQARSGSYVSAVVALDGPDGADDDRTDAVSTPAQVVTVGDESVEIEDRVEATIRRIYTQEGVTRYGVKFQPLQD
ncbi:zinc ribbon domain-containing protein [Salinarchaeum chitinilyticum]